MVNGEKISIDMELNADDVIEKLEKIKQLTEDIKQIDKNLSLNNVLEIDSNSIVVFKTKGLYKEKTIEELERRLSDKLRRKCILLQCGVEIDKAIKIGIDNNEQNKDYTTETYYDKQGKVIREQTTQYK